MVTQSLAGSGSERQNRRLAQSGFTLLEMIVVMVVAALLAGVAIPSFLPAIAGARMKAACNDIASALRFAHGQAMSRGREAVFSLDVDKHQYRVSGKNRTFTLPGSVKLDLFTAKQELSEEGEGSIRFFPDGSATGGRVTLEANGRKRIVDVNWLTGAIVVREESS